MLSVLTTIRNKIKMEQDKELNLYGCNRYPHIIEVRVPGDLYTPRITKVPQVSLLFSFPWYLKGLINLQESSI